MEEPVSGIQTMEDLLTLADPFSQLMNDMQTVNGKNVHDVLAAGLYALGCALAQTGHHIDVNAPIAEMTKPLAMGYNESIERLKKKMI